MTRFYIAALLFIMSLTSAIAQPKPGQQTPVYSSWVQVGRAADINATTASFNETLGSTAPVAVVYNQGLSWAYVMPSTTNISQVTTANGIPVPPGSCAWIGLAGQTNIAAIATAPTTLQIALGYGVPGSCGGAAGGSASAVYGPTGVGVAASFPPVLIGGTIDGSANGLMQPWRVTGGVGFINCANCSGSGASGVDEATFSPGSPTVMAPGGGFYQTTATNNPLTNLQMGMWQFTANRAGFVNLRNSSGVEVGTNAVPLYVQGQFWQTTQPVSGTVTATQGAGGNITPWTTSTPDTRPGGGSITTQDVGSGSSAGQSGVTIWSGTATTGSFYAQAINGQGVARFNVTSSWAGTLTFEGSVDLGNTWVAQPVRVSGTSYTVASITSNGQFIFDTSGLTNIRLRATAPITGTAVIAINEGTNPGAVQVLNPVRIFDNVSGAQATIKPASTAPVGTDTSVVTALNPNSTLPPFGTTPTFNCGTGCGGGSGGSNASVSTTGTAVPGSATYLGMMNTSSGNLVGLTGTGVGLKVDGSGAVQPVVGTFWPYTMGQQVAGQSVPVVLPAGQVTALTPPTSVGISGTLPAFAATPTFNIGSMPSITGTVGVSILPALPAGTNLIGSVGIAGSLPLPSGAATAANQATNSATTTHTCLTTGYSELGCLGQIDDDIKGPISAGTNTIGSVNIAGTLPAFAATPTVNIGTGSVGISGTLPAFAATPTVNIGTGAPIAPFSAYSKSSITRLANTTTYTPNTGWNSTSPSFFSFTTSCRVVGGQVLIPQIDIYSSSNPTTTLSGTLWLFSSVPGTNISDNSTFTIASADFANLTGAVTGFPFTLANGQGSTGAANSSASLNGVTYHGQCASGTTTITGMVEVTNAYVPASAEVLTVGVATVGTN